MRLRSSHTSPGFWHRATGEGFSTVQRSRESVASTKGTGSIRGVSSSIPEQIPQLPRPVCLRRARCPDFAGDVGRDPSRRGLSIPALIRKSDDGQAHQNQAYAEEVISPQTVTSCFLIMHSTATRHPGHD